MTMQDDYGNTVRIAGSLDNGAIDVEHTPRPERIICGSDDTYATRQQIEQLAADFDTHFATQTDVTELGERMNDFEQRLRNVETHVHRILNTPPSPRLVIDADSVPWQSIGHCLSVAIYGLPLQRETAQAAEDWINANAPKEAAE